MKTYVNQKFNLVEDDEIYSSNATNIFCALLFLIAVDLCAGCIYFAISAAKDEAKAYGDNLRTELCNLMEFNGSTYHCEG